MTNLVFLEAATQSEGAATIIESNEALINFATAEVDSLVEEQALHTAWHVGSFVEESFDITYENMTDPISDIVVEATSIFADVIASDGFSDMEKKELIEGYAHIIAMGDGELISENLDPAYIAASGARGAISGAGLGAGIGAVYKMFSKERKAWKALVKQEKHLKETGANPAKLKQIATAKEKAKEIYKKAKDASIAKGAKVGGAVGAVTGVAGSALTGALT